MHFAAVFKVFVTLCFTANFGEVMLSAERSAAVSLKSALSLFSAPGIEYKKSAI